ncbi:MAG: ATP-grasp domain-containing protein [Acidobacteriota bacterium]|nr:ATP-grasp domain-containing protein [Acidobacteriota bacterium]
MPRILILSTTTGYQLRSFAESAARAGIELILATDRCHRLDDPWRDAAVAVRFHEEQASTAAIVEAARHRPIDGVLPLGDRPVPLAARVAGALGLRGNPPHAAQASANKTLARSRFASAGLPVPWFVEVPPGDAEDPRIQYPCVVKPVGLSGSRGVIRADTPAQLEAAFVQVRALLARKDVRAARTGLEDTILIEGFIEGREFAVEGVLTAGSLRAFAIFDKPDPLDGPYFEETIYVTPSALPLAQQAAILEQVQRAASALGLTNGPLHAECRVGSQGVFMLEVAARPIGGLCARVLQFDASPSVGRVPLEEILLRHAAGGDISGYKRESQAAAVMMIPIPKRGILKQVEGIELASAVPGIEEVRITAKTDQLLERLPEAGSYLGFIFARGADPGDLVSALKAAQARLRFRIETALTIVGG